MSLPEDKYKPGLPEDYFGKFSDKLNKKIIEEEVFDEKEYPFLFGMEKDKDFILPAGYLNDFQFNLNPISSGSKINYKTISIAAAVIIAVLIFALSIPRKTTNEEEFDSVEILQEFAEQEAFFEDYFDDDLEYLLYNESEEIFTDIEEDVLLDYLNDNADDLDLALLY